ncbi:hypothetical protein EMPS_11640 [Entomortierella parvispora]|uniref:Uncharacterized protein n=1 Tax=Entomortierella parvispora TaxID=205924 RepID=A0A9P3HML8_9FUNG|nr:hypothetical protein EMPS_11596 [Entomortierella parvispora]GJJ79279.1 hypothetical protein EMPS_11640 [Entomortierella parvispora]
MPLRLPESARTPKGLWPRMADDTPNPLSREKALTLDVFFHEELPIRWLPEFYAERYGGSTQGFVDGLITMSSWRHFPLKSFVHDLLTYCESDRGKEQLGLLSSYSRFQVVSDHLAVNAGSCSGDQLKENMYPFNEDGSKGLYGQKDNGQEDRRQKKARVESSKHQPHPFLSKKENNQETVVVEQQPRSSRSSSDFYKDRMEQESHAFFNSEGSLEDIVLENLRDGRALPPWAKGSPTYKLKLKLKVDWSHQVTALYESARAKSVLDHTHVDEIALLSGILHLDKKHVGFSEQEIKSISNEVVEGFYSKEMREQDIQRAVDASTLWAGWIEKWRLILHNEKVAARKEDREPMEVISTEPLVEEILSSYAECKVKRITSIFFIALHIFRQYNNWATLVSESDCMMTAVGPILNEILTVPQRIKFTYANACTSVGKTRKARLSQDGQPRQPDVIGRTAEQGEVFYGELKGLHPKAATVNTDILRLAIFSKDTLDHLHNTLVRGPPLLTFLSVGSDVTFYLATKVDNTIVHCRLSHVCLPSSLKKLDLDFDFFFNVFQVQSLISVADICLKKKREKPLQETFFPTLGTPERKAAMKSPKKKEPACLDA